MQTARGIVWIVAGLLTVALRSASATPKAATRVGAQQPALDLTRLSPMSGVTGASLPSNTTAPLTIDQKLQEVANTLLRDANPLWGGMMIVNVNSGRVLAFSQYRRGASPRYQELASRLAPSASVFKLVTTAALLERTPVTLRTQVCVEGGEHGLERRHLSLPSPRDAHCLPFFNALGFSVNAAYAQIVTQYLSRTDLGDMLDRFGFNREFSFAPDALVGRVTVPFGDLDFARTATGFDNTSLTVVGAAHLALTIAREGQAAHMHLVDEDSHAQPPVTHLQGERTIRAATARRIARMMEVTVHSGTALEAFTDETTGMSYLADLRAAGKTGTLHKKGQARTVSWFTGFAPARSPEVVVSVLLENGTAWRRKAADVARDALRAHFSGHRGITAPTL